jgi:hypothetical protein
MLLLPLKS